MHLHDFDGSDGWTFLLWLGLRFRGKSLRRDDVVCNGFRRLAARAPAWISCNLNIIPC